MGWRRSAGGRSRKGGTLSNSCRSASACACPSESNSSRSTRPAGATHTRSRKGAKGAEEACCMRSCIQACRRSTAGFPASASCSWNCALTCCAYATQCAGTLGCAAGAWAWASVEDRVKPRPKPPRTRRNSDHKPEAAVEESWDTASTFSERGRWQNLERRWHGQRAKKNGRSLCPDHRSATHQADSASAVGSLADTACALSVPASEEVDAAGLKLRRC